MDKNKSKFKDIQQIEHHTQNLKNSIIYIYIYIYIYINEIYQYFLNNFSSTQS
jgi:hypothetical protein